jgi:hypothetical protein
LSTGPCAPNNPPSLSCHCDHDPERSEGEGVAISAWRLTCAYCHSERSEESHCTLSLRDSSVALPGKGSLRMTWRETEIATSSFHGGMLRDDKVLSPLVLHGLDWRERVRVRGQQQGVSPLILSRQGRGDGEIAPSYGRGDKGSRGRRDRIVNTHF